MKFEIQNARQAASRLGRAAVRFIVWVATAHAMALLLVMLIPPLVLACVDLDAARSQYLALRRTLTRLPSIETAEPRAISASGRVIERTINGLSIRTVANEWPSLIGERRCTVRREGTAASGANLEVATSVYLAGLGGGRRWLDVPDDEARLLGLTKPQLMAAAVEHCVLHEEKV